VKIVPNEVAARELSSARTVKHTNTRAKNAHSVACVAIPPQNKL